MDYNDQKYVLAELRSLSRSLSERIYTYDPLTYEASMTSANDALQDLADHIVQGMDTNSLQHAEHDERALAFFGDARDNLFSSYSFSPEISEHKLEFYNIAYAMWRITYNQLDNFPPLSEQDVATTTDHFLNRTAEKNHLYDIAADLEIDNKRGDKERAEAPGRLVAEERHVEQMPVQTGPEPKNTEARNDREYNFARKARNLAYQEATRVIAGTELEHNTALNTGLKEALENGLRVMLYSSGIRDEVNRGYDYFGVDKVTPENINTVSETYRNNYAAAFTIVSQSELPRTTKVEALLNINVMIHIVENQLGIFGASDHIPGAASPEADATTRSAYDRIYDLKSADFSEEMAAKRSVRDGENEFSHVEAINHTGTGTGRGGNDQKPNRDTASLHSSTSFIDGS